LSANPHPDGFLIHAQALLEILVAALFVAGFIVQPFRIPSPSMQPTLMVGDFLLGNKQAFAPPGDRLHLRDGLVYLNGNPLPEPYAAYAPAPPDTFRDDFPSLRSADPNVDPRWWIQLRHTIVNGEIVVPPNHYFVMGDNRNNSEDSRYWGFVSRDAIVGRPLLVYFSIAPPPTPTLWSRCKSTLHQLRILH